MTRQRAHDHVIAQVAAGQHGVVGRHQLLDAGVPRHVIDERVKQRRLVLLRRGVYAVGHRELRREGEWLAAVLSFGPLAALGHRSATALWDLDDGPLWPIHIVTGQRSGRRRRRGVAAHWALVPEPERDVHRGVPVTSIERTILDVAAVLAARPLEQIIRRAARRRRFDLREQRAVLDRHPRHRGAPALGRLLATLEGAGTADLRSPMEEAFAQLCDDFDVPRPIANRVIEGERVDFSWPGSSLIVETDSFEFHAMPTTFANDRVRDQKLTLAGYTVLRLTYAQVTADRPTTATLVSTMLQRCRAR
jgi:hypothetical protein